MRPVEPTEAGTATNPADGVTVHWEVFGSAGPTVFLLPTWTIVHARVWKFQVPFLARNFRVITADPRGNGRSDRPTDPEGYLPERLAGDGLAVLDACGADRATVVAFSSGGPPAIDLALDHPGRVEGVALIGPHFPGLGLPPMRRADGDGSASAAGWAAHGPDTWVDDHRGFVEFFFGELFSEPFSTKGWEDAVGWAMESDGGTLLASVSALGWHWDAEQVLDRCRRLTCPVLMIHGTDDRITSYEANGRAIDAVPDGRVAALDGCGHGPLLRHPVRVNLELDRFLGELHPRPVRAAGWTRGLDRRHRVLYVSSPIGLGHARRDVAIADELINAVPGVEIDWLAQHPVTSVLEAEGHRIHPASPHLASESAHITQQACEHDLHAFQALRDMDEILLANFHTFQQVVDDEPYDLVVTDEAWDIDHFWFENPELKRAPLVWMTDFVGYLPMPSGGDREAFVAADYNAEMIEHVERFPAVRDGALFVGDPEDIVAGAFGPDLPEIRAWTEDHFDFPGYVTGFDPAALGEREELRHRLGFRPDEVVCIVAVGGSGVGGSLLSMAVGAFDEARRAVPGLRMIAVCGPRIDPASFPARPGLEVVGYVPRLYRHLAAADIAIVQGGLTTTMELVAGGRPFLYAPLRDHFEQQLHVRHRLDRYRAGRYVDVAAATPASIASDLVEELGRTVSYRPVGTDGAHRAARHLAEILT